MFLPFAMISGSESGCSGLRNQAFGIRVNCKNQLVADVCESVDLNTLYRVFFMALGAIFETFGALETGLKFDDF